MYTRKAHATRETPTRDRDDQPDAREGQAAADAGPRDGYGQMRLAGAGAADQQVLRCSARKPPLARSRISASLIGVPVKSKLSMSLASGSLAMVS